MTTRDPGPERQDGVRLTPQLLLGIIVMIVGVTLTLDNLGLVESRRILRFWPIAVLALGLVKLWHSREGHGGAFGGFVFTCLGTWLFLEQTAVVQLSFWDMWPTLLVFLGGFLVWQGLSGPRVRPPVGDGNTTVSGMAILGSVVRGNNSPAFRGGELTAVLGGCEIDLRHAEINGEATLELFVVCGGMEITVPDDWTVVSRVTPILGGLEDKTRPPRAATQHRLVLRGIVVMGGIEVKN